MGSHRSLDLKEAVVAYYERLEKPSMERTAKTFAIPKETVRRWVSRKKSTGSTKYLYRGSMSYKVEKQHVDFIKELIQRKKDIYMHEVKQAIEERFPGFTITPQHISNIVQDFPFSRKLWTKRHYPQTRYGRELNLERDKAAFFAELRKFSLNDIIALDETSIEIGLSRGRARCYLGQRCLKTTDNNAIFQRFSLLMAISVYGVERWFLKKGAVQTDELHAFLDPILARQPHKKLVVMDNAPIHKNKTDQFVRERGHELLYSLPYQHYLNPIENFFNQLKHYMRDKVPLNEQEVKVSIEYAITKITQKHLQNYFLNAYDPEKFAVKNRQNRNSKRNYKENS